MLMGSHFGPSKVWLPGKFLLMALMPAMSWAQWIQQGMDIDGEIANDRSGFSVSLSSDGTRVAIGAPENDGNGKDSGQVRVYEWISQNWVQRGPDIDGEVSDDLSGYSVSLSSSGTRVAIGAPKNDDNGTDSGHVRVYEWISPIWVQKGSDIDGDAIDHSGSSVSLSSSGTRVAIGAPFGGDTVSESGLVRVYQWLPLTSSWDQVGSDIQGEAAGDQSGTSVSLSADGSRLAIGAPGNDGNGTSSGHVRIYSLSGSNWVQMGPDIDGESPGDWSGHSVSLSSFGTRVAIGASLSDDNGSFSGHVRVYQWLPLSSSWEQVGSDIQGAASGDRYGSSVSLSADGTRLAVGAPRNSTAGALSGHVRVYRWIAAITRWMPVSMDIGGEAEGDQSGASVALTDDGTHVAIGAPYNDGNGGSSGHVRVYRYPLFADGFESGDTFRWSMEVPGP